MIMKLSKEMRVREKSVGRNIGQRVSASLLFSVDGHRGHFFTLTDFLLLFKIKLRSLGTCV